LHPPPENQTSDVLREKIGEGTNMIAAECMAHQDVRTLDSGGSECIVELGRDPFACARQRAGIAEARAGAVVAAVARELGDPWLHRRPSRCPVEKAGIEHDGWRTRAEADEVEPGSVTGGRDQPRAGIDIVAGGGGRRRGPCQAKKSRQ
jgi:hypothetical protein